MSKHRGCDCEVLLTIPPQKKSYFVSEFVAVCPGSAGEPYGGLHQWSKQVRKLISYQIYQLIHQSDLSSNCSDLPIH